jgi:4-hydroxy-3-polyprenylbenzoate decarboxylase
MGKCTVVVTGASGSAYGMRVIEQLVLAGHDVSVVFTNAGREVTAFELGFTLPTEDRKVAAVALAAYLELPNAERLRVVVAPCSMGFVASVARGMADDLAERAADVMLKERRPLVLVPRETPLSLIHLRNLTAAAEAGAIIVPAMPAFYTKPESIDDLVGFVVGKVLDVLDVDHNLFDRWGE